MEQQEQKAEHLDEEQPLLDKGAIKTREGFARLEYVDGLRAIAALWVVFSHFAVLPAPLSRWPVSARLLSVLLLSRFAVMMFLTISGFCLYYPLARKNPVAPTLNLSYGSFVARRARRLMPPYFAALFLSLGLLFLSPTLDIRNPDPTNAASILSHVLLVHNLIQAHQNAINGPMWSLGLEWQLYLLFPLLVWALRRLRPVPTCFLALVAAVVVRALYTHLSDPALAFAVRMSPISYCIVFLMGMCAAKIVAAPSENSHGKVRAPFTHGLLWIGALGSFAFLFAFAGTPGTQALRIGPIHLGGGLFHDVLAALGTCCLIVLASQPQSRLRRVLSAPWLVRIGLVSYSLYLLHAPVSGLVMRLLESLHLHRDLISWLFAPLALSASLFVARWSFEWFEKPFMGAPRAKRNTNDDAAQSPAIRS